MLEFDRVLNKRSTTTTEMLEENNVTRAILQRQGEGNATLKTIIAVMLKQRWVVTFKWNQNSGRFIHNSKPTKNTSSRQQQKKASPEKERGWWGTLQISPFMLSEVDWMWLSASKSPRLGRPCVLGESGKKRTSSNTSSSNCLFTSREQPALAQLCT